jgi:hypothetical protein
MALAIAVTLAQKGLGNFVWIGLAMAIGAVIGVVGARSVKMTAMPQMVALFNGVGGGAVALIALAEFHNLTPLPGELPAEESITILLSALIGSISFSGSLIAFAKLQELLSGRPIVYPGQQYVNAAVLLTALVLGGLIVAGAEGDVLIVALIVAALTFGVLFVLPIGGADMPVVISLLNAFTGLAACCRRLSPSQQRAHRRRCARRSLGHAADADDGPGDEPLDRQRPLRGVRRGRGGSRAGGARGRPQRSLDDAGGLAIMLNYGRKVVFVPGYGLAVAQAQHDVRALAEQLEAKGVDVSTASTRSRPHAGAHERAPSPRRTCPTTSSRRWTRSTRSCHRPTSSSSSAPTTSSTRPRAPIRAARSTDADHRRRPGGHRRRRQALAQPRVRRNRQPALLRPEDVDALRGREEGARGRRRRAEGAVSSEHPVLLGPRRRGGGPAERAYDAVHAGFLAHARGEWTMQPKLYVTNYPAGDFRAMPALGGGHALLKWVTSFPAILRVGCRP